ncbi:MFS transporter [Candidatus Tisiphia endosymbiont of Nedyus quadrimaculatus]|uniref:MFS transporter n=1 Tax=Candidatus Tisiphia endosymbiont of Nedyus quadrimaculatus TaxID=3139332 RepID=UPI00345EB921
MDRADGRVIYTQTSLTKQQKEAIGLLSIGTFLEYFDLMLYVHMAVLLNELFFPKYDPFTTSLITASAFCSIYIFRPIGALIFGWLGDNIGRKSTVIITTSMMAISCITMANLPTYAQIGVTASWFVTICRIVQSMSSLGETIGAELYITEITKPPIQYPAVSLVTLSCSLGGMAALAIGCLVTENGFNWRIAFWIGAGIALVGSIARTTLRETPEFVDAKRHLKKILDMTSDKINIDKTNVQNNPIYKEKVNPNTLLALFLMDCTWPFCFYFAYVHCASILKVSFGYSAEQVIHQNFIVSIIQLLGICLLTYLSYIIYPLKILKVIASILFIFVLFCPYLLDNIKTPFDLLLIQSFIMFFIIGPVPAVSIVYRHFPVFKRFTSVSFIFALSRALMYVITSFGIVYLTEYLGNWGLLLIILPTIIGFIVGLYHFEKLEKEAGNYPQKSDIDYVGRTMV